MRKIIIITIALLVLLMSCGVTKHNPNGNRLKCVERRV